jgi:putative ABC transport system ATP-binding protein
MIELDNLSKTFNPGEPNAVRALHEVSLSILPEEFLILVGSNGSGKSTLLNCIAGSVLPSRGTIRIDGRDVSRMPVYRRSAWVGRVFQDPSQGSAANLSVLENFRLASLRTSKKTLRIGLDQAFTDQVRERVAALGMGLEQQLHQPMGTLSGGQRQALSLLMAVMDDIRILLLDEPTAALDPRSAEMVLDVADRLISDYAVTAVMVTHNLKEAHRLGSRIVQMDNGRVLRDISSAQKAQLSLSDLYGWFG